MKAQTLLLASLETHPRPIGSIEVLPFAMCLMTTDEWTFPTTQWLGLGLKISLVLPSRTPIPLQWAKVPLLGAVALM